MNINNLKIFLIRIKIFFNKNYKNKKFILKAIKINIKFNEKIFSYKNYLLNLIIIYFKKYIKFINLKKNYNL